MVPDWTRPLFALLLTVLCPPSVILLVHTHLKLDGSIEKLGQFLANDPLYYINTWRMLLVGTFRLWTLIVAFLLSTTSVKFFLSHHKQPFLTKTSGDQLVASIVTSLILFAQFVPVKQLLEFDLPGEGSTVSALQIIGCFASLQLLLVRILPGQRFEGPITEHGNVPIYKVNGFKAFCITVFLFWFCSMQLKWFNGGILYDHYERIIACLNVFALGFCGLLTIKGLYAPSSTDCGSTGNIITDYYWGTELYPRILGWDVKTFTNCRFGMMLWPILCLSYCAKQYEDGKLSDSMLVSVGIQLVYCAKFFYWESGYWRSTDIHTDRAGFYICWGCLCWVPSLYTAHTLYLVKHPIIYGNVQAVAMFIVGVAAVFLNYWADAQRVEFRATNGKCLIWGKKPVYLEAQYKTTKGDTHTSLLLASGWWGISRHWHYVPELTAAFMWCAPAGNAPLAYAYFIFLTILLVDRSFRDDDRCATKYGKDWDKYKELVPWRILPGVL